ncbi:MAG: hypothetical protein LBQ54_03690 [Planctomycetaceae bacterium]|nr:hypothetical protein [Planctomycetaceae bacterium]
MDHLSNRLRCAEPRATLHRVARWSQPAEKRFQQEAEGNLPVGVSWLRCNSMFPVPKQ